MWRKKSRGFRICFYSCTATASFFMDLSHPENFILTAYVVERSHEYWPNKMKFKSWKKQAYYKQTDIILCAKENCSPNGSDFRYLTKKRRKDVNSPAIKSYSLTCIIKWFGCRRRKRLTTNFSPQLKENASLYSFLLHFSPKWVTKSHGFLSKPNVLVFLLQKFSRSDFLQASTS